MKPKRINKWWPRIRGTQLSAANENVERFPSATLIFSQPSPPLLALQEQNKINRHVDLLENLGPTPECGVGFFFFFFFLSL